MIAATRLHEGWTLSTVGEAAPDSLRGIEVPATVPGVVHTDLLAAGLIEDPYVGLNEDALTWIGRVEWIYRTSFTAEQARSGPRTDLVLEGLDTLATVTLNGVEILRTANQHRSYRVEVTDVLLEGRNDLVVRFAPALTVAEEIDAVAHRPHVNPHPFNALRKMACNFGWDWGPAVVTAGVFKPVRLETWSGVRIAGVRPLVLEVPAAAGEGPARVRFAVDLDRADARPVALAVRLGEETVRAVVPPEVTRIDVDVAVPAALLWWPRGYGDQTLYAAQVEVLEANAAEPLDTWSGRVGLRTTAVDTSTDDGGATFRLLVNGRAVLIKGFNWIPEDPFPSNLTSERVRSRIADAAAAGANLLRVWGGGTYESETFYDACDELGLLVWQDFAFACAAYDEERLGAEVEAEAREAITRLAVHPSLALWNGGNENLWGYQDWGWQEVLGDASWGLGFYTELLPRLVGELDPTRPYIPGSPFSPEPDVHPNSPDSGPMHIWTVWNTHDYTHYADYRPRFVSEFGFQGPPAWSSLIRVVGNEDFVPTQTPEVLSHQKADDGNGKLERGWRGHLPDPATARDWHWTTQLNQARAVEFGIRHFRSLHDRCHGTIVWQLNDCWPVISWSAVDGDGHRKPLWFAARRAFADRLLTINRLSSELELSVLNDSDDRWTGALQLVRRDLAGDALATATHRVDVPPRGAARIPLGPEMDPFDPAAEVLDARLGSETLRWFYAEDIDLRLPAVDVDVAADPVPGGYRVTVAARSLVRDLTLLVDQADPGARVDDALVTLLPGERAVFEVSAPANLDPSVFTSYPVLRCANDLVTPISAGVSRASHLT